MFVESLLDSGASRGSHRGWATLVSFTTQALAVSGLLPASTDLHRGSAETSAHILIAGCAGSTSRTRSTDARALRSTKQSFQ